MTLSNIPRLLEDENSADSRHTPSFKRLGLLFQPAKHFDWMQTHAANPTPIVLQDELVRVFFSCRDASNRSHVGYVDVDLGSRKVVHISEKPVLSPGELGYFDDSGITASCIVNTDNGSHIFYYLGWNLTQGVPFRNSIGAAIGTGLGEFKKISLAPILDRSALDPLTLSYPWVLREGNAWRMWYGTHISWATERYEMLHVLAHAESTDGINWRPTGHISLPFIGEDEFGFSRPCVVHEDGIYKMWFSVRGKYYKIGYAESSDGLRWQRLGYCLTGSSNEAWDSDSAAYGAIVDCRNQRYMVYCGNGYGKTGFGLAMQEQQPN